MMKDLSSPVFKSRARIAVVDYCKGNLRSVQKGFIAVGYDAFITDDSKAILEADGIVLPGVGSFYDAMSYMRETGQNRAITEKLSAGTPFLGICLGMQLLMSQGSEGAPDGGHSAGLDLIRGECTRLTTQTQKIPHVGWNTVDFTAKGASDQLFSGIDTGSYFYFTHSYFVTPEADEIITATTSDGKPFVSALSRGNIYGVQFHPEKSSTIGLAVLSNFGQIVHEAYRGRNS